MVATCALLGTGTALGQSAPAPVVGPSGRMPATPPGGEESRTSEDKPEVFSRRADLSGPSYTIYQLVTTYARPNPGLPSIESVDRRPFQLGFVDGRWTSPTLAEDYGGKVVTVTIEKLNLGEDLKVGDYDGTRVFHVTAMLWILEEIRFAINEAGIVGVRTIFDPDTITITGEDLRQSASDPIGILILTAEVTAQRTIAAGKRFDVSQRVNNPKHERILRDSPLQLTPEGAEVQNPKSLLRRDQLDRYTFHLNRHPGRRVDVALSQMDEPGTTQLDYHINENKMWSVYYQLTNTGTETTGEIRHRVGYLNNQLTNNDDSFNFDYIFSDLHDPGSQAAIASYELPVFDPRLRGRVQAMYAEYDASELGVAREDFQGNTYAIDAQLAWNFYQRRNFFLDAIGGIDFRRIHVDNENLGSPIEATEHFLTPYIGIAAERVTDRDRLLADLRLVADFDWLDHDADTLRQLGRTQPDSEWVILRYNGYFATYLEPVFNRDAWEDPSTPESSTLAHEAVFRVNGQYGFDNRLVPQYESVVGGLYTVRGYPESIAAGDTSFIASAEYRYHVPRAFPVDRTPDRTLFGEPFRVSPQELYAQPDWDLTLKVFADVGMTYVSQKRRDIAEQDETMFGVGVGAGLLIKQNISADVDFGVALVEAQSGTPDVVEQGDSRVHFSVTVLY
ncbi:ShlB/FhaC/HecB family hemolysin secretion/activation protein [Mucisphaera calidilacus]|nr:ShlB/FhaC/HecB family hemolysin secretion/activation protein [Mucisphaera calidilacus]